MCPQTNIKKRKKREEDIQAKGEKDRDRYGQGQSQTKRLTSRITKPEMESKRGKN